MTKIIVLFISIGIELRGVFHNYGPPFYIYFIFDLFEAGKALRYVFEESDLTTNDKMTANRIVDLNDGVYGQKKFSWIYMNSTSVKVQYEDT
jgi:hypothetical protein